MAPSERAAKLVSEAVRNWFDFYDLTPDDGSTDILCAAAVDLCNGGLVTVDAITSSLIETYVGRLGVQSNAPTSIAIH
jgi:hypothetical protein